MFSIHNGLTFIWKYNLLLTGVKVWWSLFTLAVLNWGKEFAEVGEFIGHRDQSISIARGKLVPGQERGRVGKTNCPPAKYSLWKTALLFWGTPGSWLFHNIEFDLTHFGCLSYQISSKSYHEEKKYIYKYNGHYFVSFFFLHFVHCSVRGVKFLGIFD